MRGTFVGEPGSPICAGSSPGMVDALKSELERHRLQLFVADTIDAETVCNQWGDPYHRVRMHEGWYHYVVDELVPRIEEMNATGQDLLVVG